MGPITILDSDKIDDTDHLQEEQRYYRQYLQAMREIKTDGKRFSCRGGPFGREIQTLCVMLSPLPYLFPPAKSYLYSIVVGRSSSLSPFSL